MKSNTQIPTPFSLFFLLSLLMPNTTQHIDADIHIPHIQKISVINQKDFEDLKKIHLDKGYYILKDCVELEVKSNTNWSLVVFDKNSKNDDNFLLRTNSLPFKPLTAEENILIALKNPTSSTIISIDCKRSVDWADIQRNSWNFSPIFKLIDLK